MPTPNKMTTPTSTPTAMKIVNLEETNFLAVNEAQNTDPAIPVTPSKRGILRRKELFDGPPTSQSPPRLDKTLINSLLQTVKHRQSVPAESSPDNSTPTRTHIDEKMNLRVPQSELKSRVLSRNSKSRSKSWDLTRSSTSTNKRSGSTRVRAEAKHNIPFWLKPTSTQTYPYNFIMAVRKKLESVTQPILVDPLPRTDTPLARPKYSRDFQPSNFRHNLDKPEESVAHESSKVFLNMIDSIPTIKTVNENLDDQLEDKAKIHKNNLPQSKPVSGSEEFSTNFSSISLHITDRNTISELSSIRSEQPNHSISPLKVSHQIDIASDGDDTTISSAILSQASPKKLKPQKLFVAPLSTEGIKDLKISSSNSDEFSKQTKQSTRLHPFVNTERGDAVTHSDHTRLTNDFDQRSMAEMFETFSRNLSQVISVNERLHSALSTSLHNNNSVERDDVSQVKMHSVHEKTDSDPMYTTSFEATNDDSIQEADGINSQTKSESNHPSKNVEENAETVKDTLTTKTVSEQQSGSVLVTTTIDTQTVTSRKTEILSNVSANDRSVDPEFRRYSTANSMIGSDIFAVFSQSDEENSLRTLNPGISGEESFNYSSIGMVSC